MSFTDLKKQLEKELEDLTKESSDLKFKIDDLEKNNPDVLKGGNMNFDDELVRLKEEAVQTKIQLQPVLKPLHEKLALHKDHYDQVCKEVQVAQSELESVLKANTKKVNPEEKGEFSERAVKLASQTQSIYENQFELTDLENQLQKLQIQEKDALAELAALTNIKEEVAKKSFMCDSEVKDLKRVEKQTQEWIEKTELAFLESMLQLKTKLQDQVDNAQKTGQELLIKDSQNLVDQFQKNELAKDLGRLVEDQKLILTVEIDKRGVPDDIQSIATSNALRTGRSTQSSRFNSRSRSKNIQQSLNTSLVAADGPPARTNGDNSTLRESLSKANVEELKKDILPVEKQVRDPLTEEELEKIISFNIKNELASTKLKSSLQDANKHLSLNSAEHTEALQSNSEVRSAMSLQLKAVGVLLAEMDRLGSTNESNLKKMIDPIKRITTRYKQAQEVFANSNGALPFKEALQMKSDNNQKQVSENSYTECVLLLLLATAIFLVIWTIKRQHGAVVEPMSRQAQLISEALQVHFKDLINEKIYMQTQ